MLENAEFVEFIHLFKPEEGRMGVTVTFISILELMKEGVLDIVQAEPYAPLHVRKAVGRRGTMVENADGDAANEAALAQPELPDENVVDDDEDNADADAQPEVTAEASADDEPSAEAADVSKSNIETNDT
jgi:segregation and condensation protein A